MNRNKRKGVYRSFLNEDTCMATIYKCHMYTVYVGSARVHLCMHMPSESNILFVEFLELLVMYIVCPYHLNASDYTQRCNQKDSFNYLSIEARNFSACFSALCDLHAFISKCIEYYAATCES